MTIALIIVAWYASGAIGLLLFFATEWRDALDIRLEDVLCAAILAVAGPITLMVGIGFSAVWLIERAMRSTGLNLDTVIWRRRGRR